MTKDTGGSAFPTGLSTGMTLRDHFAGLAMHLATNLLREDYLKNVGDDWRWDNDDWEVIAESSYAMADAMLERRKK